MISQSMQGAQESLSLWHSASLRYLPARSAMLTISARWYLHLMIQEIIYREKGKGKDKFGFRV